MISRFILFQKCTSIFSELNHPLFSFKLSRSSSLHAYFTMMHSSFMAKINVISSLGISTNLFISRLAAQPTAGWSLKDRPSGSKPLIRITFPPPPHTHPPLQAICNPVPSRSSSMRTWRREEGGQKQCLRSFNTAKLPDGLSRLESRLQFPHFAPARFSHLCIISSLKPRSLILGRFSLSV